jgi:hypothetical protein
VNDQRIRKLIQSGQYEFSKHAEREREADEITMAEFEEALAHCETIEEYPNDPVVRVRWCSGFPGIGPFMPSAR